MRLFTKQFICTAMALCMWGPGAFASPITGPEGFDDGNDHGWSYDVYTDGQATPPGTTGGVVDDNGNWCYELYFTATPQPGQQYGWIFNNTADYQGDYSGQTVTFDFWSSPAPPNTALSVYFIGNGEKWTRSFVVPVGEWTGVQVDFVSGWSSISGVDFASDIMNVTEIGVQVNHLNANGSTFTYRMDNWGLAVPEPESYALALAVLVSLGVTFRRRLTAWVRRSPAA